MGGFFGAVSKRDTVLDVFFGTDYHSHLGTRRGGRAAYDETKGLQRKILHTVRSPPLSAPYFSIASIPYSEQVGIYLHVGAVFSPDKYAL